MMLWFLVGLCAAAIAVGMFGVFRKQHITKLELLIIIILIALGPIAFVLTVITIIVKWMIEIDDNPNTTIFDWRAKSNSVECPKCAWSNEDNPVGRQHCPRCMERLLVR